MYARCGALDDSIAVFSSHPSCPRDVFSWNFVVASCSRHGHGSLALSFFRRMMLEGVVPDMVTFAAVFSSFLPCSSSSSPPPLREGKLS
jgi:pentatricopeptide repeat protein